jgi:hypothetical protein
MSGQKLVRIDARRFAVVDHELALVMDGSHSEAAPALLGFAFLTRASGWRLVRASGADIGYAPLVDLALARIVEDADELSRAALANAPAAPDPERIAKLAEAIRKALPL